MEMLPALARLVYVDGLAFPQSVYFKLLRSYIDNRCMQNSASQTVTKVRPVFYYRHPSTALRADNLLRSQYVLGTEFGYSFGRNLGENLELKSQYGFLRILGTQPQSPFCRHTPGHSLAKITCTQGTRYHGPKRHATWPGVDRMVYRATYSCHGIFAAPLRGLSL